MSVYVIIIIVLTIFYGGLILFYYTGWLNLGEWKIKPVKAITKVTVIVAARNEEENIGKCIQDILAQDYPAHLFELIVVDDFSIDKTVEEVKKKSSPILRLIQMKDVLKEDEEQNSFKKRAIEQAIQQANGDLILTTDADCRMNAKWISSIVSFYEATRFRFIVSPVTFTDDKTFFEKIQTLDFLGLMGISGGALAFRFPTMCNGANLAYEKKVFQEVNGFRGVDNLASGDDMMLMQKVNKKYPGSVGYLKCKDAIVSTFPKRTFKSFFQQRLRWISKSAYYPDKRITFVLAMAYLFNFLLLGNAIFSLFDHSFVSLFLLQLGVKLLFEFFFLLAVTGFFRRRALLILFLPAQLLHIFYVVTVGLLGNFMTYNWKERKTR